MSRIAILVPGKIHDRVLERLKDRFEIIAVAREERLALDGETAGRIRGGAVSGAFPGAWMDQLPHVEVIDVGNLNPLSLASHEKVLLTVAAVTLIEERLQ